MHTLLIFTKRITLFLLTTSLVTLNIIFFLWLFNLIPFFTKHHTTLLKLSLYCFLWSIIGTTLCVFFCKTLAKMFMHIIIIHPTHAHGDEAKLINQITELSKLAGLKNPPEIGIYRSPELNAISIGPTKNSAMIAVSTGLLANMKPEQLKAVLAHEINHIATGDMVTLNLIQSVINSFSPLISRVFTYIISVIRTRQEEPPEDNISLLTYGALTLFFDILSSLLGRLIVAAFSRQREYQADKGSARLAGPLNMIAALQQLRSATELEDEHAPSMSVFKIAHKRRWFELIENHPDFRKRISRLEKFASLTQH